METYFFSFPLSTYKNTQQQLLPDGNSEGTRHLIVLSGEQPCKSRCRGGQGLVVTRHAVTIVCSPQIHVSSSLCSFQLQAQKLRLARSQGPYYSGSLPNVNQIGRNPQDFQVTDDRRAAVIICFN